MKNKTSLALAVGAALGATLAAAPAAAASPFGLAELSAGYMLGGAAAAQDAATDQKDAEGKCGEDAAAKDKEGSCGEDKKAEGQCGG